MRKGRRVSHQDAARRLTAFTQVLLVAKVGDAQKEGSEPNLPRLLQMAGREAGAFLNRREKRALGARGDGSYHPMARPATVVRSRNRW